MKRFLAVTAVSLALAACGPNKIGNQDAGDNGDGGGPVLFACPGSSLTYPAGPYATTHGKVFPDYVFTGPQFAGSGGYFDSSIAPARTPANDIPGSSLGNPSSSPYFSGTMAMHQLFCAQQAGFKYALIDISSVWCPHCQDEARQMPTQWVVACPAGKTPPYDCGWNSRGGIVLSVLEDGINQGVPATMNELNSWVETYNVNYPITLDPQETLGTGISVQGYPTNIILDLTTMKVYDAVAGATFAFFDEFDKLLPPP